MGRPAKPYALHIAQGTDRSRVKKREADTLKLKPGSVGSCPSWICPEGREEWNRLTRDKDYSRCLVPSMRGTMIRYCSMYGRMIRTEREMVAWVDGKELRPILNEDGSVKVEAPRQKFSVSEGQTLHSLSMQLGLTPASQSKVHVPVEAADDGWSDL